LQAAGIRDDGEGLLFRAWRKGRLVPSPQNQSNIYKMIRHRAAAAGIRTKIGCHSLRATGITNYLENGGRLEVAQQMPATKAPGAPASMTDAGMRFHSTKSNAFRISFAKLFVVR
jgi:integrase